ncbi:hypothetical protein MNB_SUP05-7-673 [hydrothermal vent metagenome]|uniref:Uncharacterized protein n=1 Tax=hydrothermal vent metagenome TaxID=652676 RepID=A0A1W1DP95_9ZZZZ
MAYLTKLSLPSLSEIELTIALPCVHFKPASMISHLDESTISGTLEISGSEAIRFINRTMAALPSNMPSSMLMSTTCAPSSTCVRQIKRLNLAEPVTLARSPTLINNDSSPILKASKPDRRHSGLISGICLGGSPSIASAMALIWSGVEPQQPPKILTKPDSAHSPTCSLMVIAPRSYSPNSFGRPAFGCAEV